MSRDIQSLYRNRVGNETYTYIHKIQLDGILFVTVYRIMYELPNSGLFVIYVYIYIYLYVHVQVKESRFVCAFIAQRELRETAAETGVGSLSLYYLCFSLLLPRLSISIYNTPPRFSLLNITNSILFRFPSVSLYYT